MADTEFWRDLKPITSVFRPDARPEIFTADAATEDERYYVPFTDTAGSRPLALPPAAGVRVHHLREEGLPGARLGGDGRRLRLRGAPLIWLDEAGEPSGHLDVFDYIELCRAHYEQVGIGAAYVDTLFR